jgi:hypothetical protein
MSRHPVQLIAAPPERFDRAQLLLRLAIAIALGFLGIGLGWIACVLYLVLPVVAGVLISSGGAGRFQVEAVPALARVIEWLAGFHAYMLMALDRVPTSARRDLRIALAPTGHPSVASALARLLTSLPAALVTAVVFAIAAVVACLGAIAVLVAERQPAGFVRFQLAVIRWQTRALAYHASLVASYPGFADGEPDPALPFAAAR